MNILPHKSWHVRTKANIARVRRDEAKAAEEEKLRQKRIELAEKEARTNLLRERARSKYDGRASADSDSCDIQSGAPDKHINFFEELEKGEANIVKGNRDYEQEKKEEQEKYEKKIGYLTYLGQDTVESTGNISWFNKLPERLTNNKDNTEVNIDKKALIDPINKLNAFLKRKHEPSTQATSKLQSAEQKKNKTNYRKHKKKKKSGRKRKLSTSSSSSSSLGEHTDSKRTLNLNDLRAKRLKREREEKERAEKLLAKLRGEPVQNDKLQEKAVITQKYNSQFNPHLAKQNYS